MKKELLAPAGDVDAGYAALYYGADAVYLGLQQFSARATAANFDEASLGEFAAYAHFLNRKVFVAINTLVQESELPDLLKNLDICVRCGVDAVIIQDLGVAEIVRKNYPTLEMHASTQMAVHNKEGALALQKFGFKRVVVARELSSTEIAEIAAVPNLETEAFIHGALCYSYSGLCFFSSMTTGMSANRGKCLYPCRANFCNEKGAEQHLFSMKDLALQEDVLQMPAYSLKIEGRKKNALYVAAVVDYYRQILDGKSPDENRAKRIRQIFSRPWCKFHFNNRDKNTVDREFVGHRGLCIGKLEQASKRSICFKTTHAIEKYDGIQIDVPGVEKPFGFSVAAMRVSGQNVFVAAAGDLVEIALPPHQYVLDKGLKVYLASAGNVKNAYPYSKPKPREFRPLVPLDVLIKVENDKIFAQSGAYTAQMSGIFELAKDIAKVAEAIEKAFAKTGETDFCLQNIVIENPEKLFVPASMLNELRRELYAQIKPEEMQGSLPEVDMAERSANPRWIIKADAPQSLQQIDLSNVAEVIAVLSPKTQVADWAFVPKDKLRWALPTVCRNVKALLPKIDALLAQGYKKWEIGNYWGLSVLPEQGLDLSFDYTIYMFNTQAVQAAKETGCSRVSLSPEDMQVNWQKVAAKPALPLVLPVYEDVALFTSAVCIRDNACTDCDKTEKYQILRRGNEVYEACSKNCQIVLCAKSPWYLENERKLVQADYYRVAFLHKNYSADEALEIWQKVSACKSIQGAFKTNLEKKI